MGVNLNMGIYKNEYSEYFNNLYGIQKIAE